MSKYFTKWASEKLKLFNSTQFGQKMAQRGRLLFDISTTTKKHLFCKIIRINVMSRHAINCFLQIKICYIFLLFARFPLKFH